VLKKYSSAAGKEKLVYKNFVLLHVFHMLHTMIFKYTYVIDFQKLWVYSFCHLNKSKQFSNSKKTCFAKD